MNAVKIVDLVKTFGTITAIDHLSLKIKQGQITGIIGANGAGKTTLLRLMIGLLTADHGSIKTLEINPEKERERLMQRIGYMPQKFGLYEDLTVLENLKLYADLKHVPHDFDAMLALTNLAPFQDRFAGKLSGGMKQKLGLACTLLGQPELLIFDEPSVGVDPISRQDLMRMVRDMRNDNATVIWSTAYLDEAHTFDTVVVLDKGRVIYQGKPHDLAPTTQEFENKVIALMGGYQVENSRIAANYKPIESDVECAVIADHLEKKYGDFYAVRDNTFEIHRGEIFGLLGPNGAGKSTSFKMMCGLAKPTSGTAKIMGIDIKKNPEKARSHLGYMAQKFSLYGNLTVQQNLDFFAAVYGIKYTERTLKIREMVEVFDLGSSLHQKSEDLPLGMKQRLSMACALIHNPPVLFLDEPTSGVDIVTRKDFWNHMTSLAKKGVTVLVTTHFMDEAEYCDRISLFYRGQAIAVRTPQELKQQAAFIMKKGQSTEGAVQENKNAPAGSDHTTGLPTMEETFIALIKGFDHAHFTDTH